MEITTHPGPRRRHNTSWVKIYILTLSGHTIPLELDLSKTIDEVMGMLEDKEGFSRHLQRLIFQENVLEIHRTLADYNIQNGSTINLVLCMMTIFVQKLTGEIFKLGVNATYSISQIRDMINEREGIHRTQQHLVFDDGLPLDDDRTLEYYNIHKGSTLHLALGAGSSLDEMEIITHPDGLRRRHHAGGDKIYIRTLLADPHRTIPLELDLSKTIADVMGMLEYKLRCPPDQLYLIFQGKRLKNHRTLADYNIQNGSNLYLRVNLRGGGMIIYVEKLTGDSFELGVICTKSISEIRDMINEKEGIHRTQQHLVFNGVPLDDDRTLQDYNIHEGSTLRLALVPLGAGSSPELPSDASVHDQAIVEQEEGVNSETEDQLSEMHNDVHGIGAQLEQKRKRWSKYSRKNLVFAVSILATYYLGSASTTSFSTGGKVVFKIAIGIAIIADAALSVLKPPPKWGNALVYLSWFHGVLASYLLLVSFNKYYGYAILLVPLTIIVALLQLKLKLWVTQQRRPGNNEIVQNGDLEEANQHQGTNNDEDDQHFDSIFGFSVDIVNCGGLITVIFGNSIMVGPASALGFLFFYTIALGLYLMMVTTVRVVSLTPHAPFLAILLKGLLAITVITSLIHGVSGSNGLN